MMIIADPWAQTGTGQAPGYIRGLPRIFPFRASTPMLTPGSRARITLVNLAECYRLAVTESPDPERIWVWARTEAAAAGAAAVMADRYAIKLEFTASQ
jgi:hypothetical protein